MLPLELVVRQAALLVQLPQAVEIHFSLVGSIRLQLLVVVAVDRIMMVAVRIICHHLLILAEVMVEVVAEVVNQNIQLQTRLQLLLHTPTVMATTAELIFQTFMVVARGKALAVVALVKQAGR